MTRLSRVFAVATLLVLAACSGPEIPDVTYFRLPPPAAPLPKASEPLTLLPIEVETFNGEGVYSEQALIYSIGTDGGALRTYHYQLWSDPPAHALQVRMVDVLRASGLSKLVTDRLPASTPALRIQGTIRRYERIRDAATYRIVVAIELRVEQDEGEPVIEKDYRSEKLAADTSLDATVAAFGAAVDEIYAAFYGDLAGLGGEAHAR